jgi:hypothetical protein
MSCVAKTAGIKAAGSQPFSDCGGDLAISAAMVKRALAISVIALVCIVTRAHADGPQSAATATAGHEAIQYRRIYVPADRIDTWPRDGEKYLPIEARNFDRWIRLANEAPIGTNMEASVRVAEYTARLDSDGRLCGTGRWTFELRGKTPARLPLDHLSLILSNVHWQGSPNQLARIGTWGKSDQVPSQFGLQVDRSGIVAFDWRIETHASGEQIEIPWRVPAANSVRLELDLPKGMQPRIDGSVVLANSTSADTMSGSSIEHWGIALSPATQDSWRILKTDHKSPTTSAKNSVRESVKYEVGPRGLEVTSTWQVEGPAEPKRELVVHVPEDLQLTSVKSGGHELEWRPVREPESKSGISIIELPPGDGSKTSQIELRAWQPLVTGAAWQLPRLRADNAYWTSGKFELSIAPSFELQSLAPAECVETNVSSVGANETPEVHQFSAYADSAGLGIRIAPRQTDATVQTGMSLSLADPDLNGRLVSQWNLPRLALHQLTGTLASGWVVETVETIPADALGEWFIDKHRSERHIEIQLSSAASRARNVSVIITGKLQHFSLAEPIPASTTQMVTWANARSTRQLLAFQSSEPFGVEPVGKLATVPADSVTELDRSLFDQTAGNSIFDLGGAPEGAGLQLTLKRAPYAANIHINLLREGDELREEGRIEIEPTTSPIDRVIVYSTSRLEDNSRWIDAASDSSLSAERLTNDEELRGNLPKGGDAWLVRLSQPTSRPFEIVVNTVMKRPQRTPVPLFWLPEAARQQASIVARANGQNSIWLDPTRVEAIPLPHEVMGDSIRQPGESPICAAYRYQPAACRNALLSPKLLASTASRTQSTSLTARHLHLESFFWADGAATHRVTYLIENDGTSELPLSLPDDAKLVTATAGGKSLEVTLPTPPGQPTVVHLPENSGAAEVSVFFETSGPALAAGRSLHWPLAGNDVPFLSGEWVVWLPEEFSASGLRLSPSSPGFNWRQRLFGPLGRPVANLPFNPLQPGDDLAATNGPSDANAVDLLKLQVNVAELNTSGLPGWRKYQESFVANGPAPMVVLHPPSMTAWSAVFLIVAFLCGRVLQRNQREVFAIVIAMVACAALLLPAVYADLATGTFLGLVLSLVAGWIRPSVFNERYEPSRSGRLASASTLVVLIVIGVAKLSRAEAPKLAAAAKDGTTNLYRVLIPSDADERPAGTKYFISERFLRILLSTESNSEPTNVEWLLRDAVYSGELRESSAGKEIVSGNWSIAFSIETLARDSTVVLPLVRNEAEWNETAMLEGVPAPLKWRDGGNGCIIRIAEPGRYSLLVSCLPKSTASGDHNRIALSIPPLPGARAELRVPESATGVLFSPASSEPVASSGGKTITALLDNRDRLQVEWLRADGSENGKSKFSLAEMRWVDVKSTEIGLRVKYVLEGTRRPDAITVAYDDRWKLLDNQHSDAIEKGTNAAPGQHLVHLALGKQSSERQEVMLEFQLRNPPDLGNLSLPMVELVGVVPSKRWVAVSADGSLDCGVVDSSAIEGTVNEFFAKWGDPTDEFTPQLALSSFDTNRPLTVAIRPRETEPVVDESLNIAAGTGGVRVNYEGRVTPRNFGDYKFELAVPEYLSIDDVLAADADPIPLRWSRPAKNRLNVFFDKSLTGPYRLVVDGRVPLDKNGSTNLPRVSSLATASATQKMRIYRDDDVRVAIAGIASSAESKAESVDEHPAEWKVRPVSVCYLDANSAAAARISVKPSVPKISGDSLTFLSADNGAWKANFRCQLNVEGGNLDVLRLRVPKTWTGPFEIQSHIPATLSYQPVNELGGVLTVRFATSIAAGGSVDVWFRGELKPTEGTNIAVPAITVESASKMRRYVWVPELNESQRALWTESGVGLATIPQKLLNGLALAGPSRSLEVKSESFQIASRPQEAPDAMPQIRLADTKVMEGEFGAQLIATRLILTSHGLSDCTVQFPAGQTLISATVDGHPALARSLDASHWQVALGSPQLPQSLEIISRFEAETINRHVVELQRPVLLASGKPIPTEVSLWSFANPLHSAVASVHGADQVTPMEQAALRFDRLVSIAEAARLNAAQLPSPDGFHWFESWAVLLLNVRSETKEAVAPQIEQADSQVSHASEEQIAKASERLNKWLDDCRKNLPGAEAKVDGATPASSATASLKSTAVGSDWSYYVAQGGSDRLVLQMSSPELSTTQVRMVGSLLIAVFLAGALWLLRSPATIDFFCRWPHVLGILVGLAYWAWLWPSWLGLIIVAASVWLALRFDWPGRSLRTEASTVMRYDLR